MKAKPYNPCIDGYVAKCWECLRRNKAFREIFDALPESGEHENITYELSGNRLAGEVIGKYADWKINSNWRAQGKQQRRKFESCFTVGTKFDAAQTIPGWNFAPFPGDEPASFAVERFNLAEMYVTEGIMDWERLNTKKAEKALCDLESIWAQYDLIAVPKMIRHDKHRKKILADIDAQIPKSLFRGITLKNDGRWLGTKTDWDIYNLYEGWINLRYSDAISQQLTAHEVKGADFGTSEEARRKRASNYLKASGSQTFTGKNKRNPETRDAIKIIKDSIASVFPKFEPYCPPGKRTKDALNSMRSD